MASAGMPTVKIQVFPVNDSIGTEFLHLIDYGRVLRWTTVTYRGVTFHMRADPNERCDIYLLLDDLNGVLPKLFGTELRVEFVRIWVELPIRQRVVSGWYTGEHLGFPGAYCCIDPEGRGGEPNVYANGTDFSNVVGLFKAVMTGKLAPTKAY